jgi:uncharacterized protein DUF6941
MIANRERTKMADVEWAMMCDYAFQDSGRKSCLIGIFDRVFATNVPTALVRSSLAIKVVGDPKEKVRVRIEIVRPTGGVLSTLQVDVELGDNGVAEVQAGIQGMPLPDWGIYGFNIYVGEESKPKTIMITVSQPPAASVGG